MTDKPTPPERAIFDELAEKGVCPICGCEELDHRGLWTCRCRDGSGTGLGSGSGYGYGDGSGNS